MVIIGKVNSCFYVVTAYISNKTLSYITIQSFIIPLRRNPKNTEKDTEKNNRSPAGIYLFKFNNENTR